MIEKIKNFWTDPFVAMNTEDSMMFLIFMGVTFLLGLLFGAWARVGKIRRLKKELAQKETELTELRTQYDKLVEQYEQKEEELKNSEARFNDMSADINRLTNERMHYQTELRSAKEQLERLQAENLAYAAKLEGLITDGENGDGNDLGISGDGGEITPVVSSNNNSGTANGNHNAVHEVYDDRLALIEEKLEKLVLENANLKEEVSNLERNALIGGGAVGAMVGAGAGIGASSSSGSTTTNTETGEAVLDLSNTVVDDAPSTYEDEVLQEDAGEMSPQERAERAKSKITSALGSKIPKANISEKDDLKKIEGIGPFIEMKLNDIGIYTYEQVSMIDGEMIRLITDAIQFFPGRIEKDDWMGQAASLMG